jgi:hypothetical protein
MANHLIVALAMVVQVGRCDALFAFPGGASVSAAAPFLLVPPPRWNHRAKHQDQRDSGRYASKKL